MVIESLCPDGLIPLWRKSQIEACLGKEGLPNWVSVSYSAFVEVIRRTNFPCFFGTIAEQREMIRYAIAPSLTEPDAISHTLEAVYKYLDEEKVIAQRSDEDALLLTLVIFFPPVEEEKTLEHYALQAWDFLNALHKLDSTPWPASIPTDAYDEKWGYCLGGRSLFFNVCTPANQKRQSRHVRAGMTFIINPVDLVQAVWKKWGEQPRRNIYRRVEQYDGMSPHPLFCPWDNQEDRHVSSAMTFVLPENNENKFCFEFRYQPKEQRESGCPFHQYSSQDT